MNGIDLATILSTIPFGLIVLSADLRVLSANRSFLEMFDLSDNGLWGQPLDGVLPAIGLREWATEVLATGEPQRNIAIVLPDGGEERILRISITRLQAPEQEGAKLLLIVDDLMGEERLRTAEQMSMERFHNLVQKVVHAIVWEADAAMRLFSFVSNRAEEILGYPAERWMREPDFWASVIVHPEEREWVTALYQKAALEGTKVQIEYRAVAADGRVVCFRDNVCVIQNADGHVQQLGGAMLDITERKVAEDSLRESEERHRRLVELCPDPICIHSGGKVLYVNPAAARVIGAASPEDLIGRPILDFIHPDYVQIVMERLQKAHQKEREPVDLIEEKFIRLDGQVIDLEVVTVGITYQGKPAIQAFFHDITERKKAEAQLAYLADHDPLTGLFNRRRFLEELERQLAHVKRYRTRGALLFLDLDGFKHVNDTLGHQAGDDLLRSMAGVLKERLRETDILARLGGDEFTIILPQADAGQARGVVEHILQTLRHHRVIIDGQRIGLSASVGIVLFSEHGATADKLLACADLAMYKAKEAGGNRYFFHELDMYG